MSNCSRVLWRVSFADCNMMHFKVIAQKLEMVNSAFSSWDEFGGTLSLKERHKKKKNTALWGMQKGSCNYFSSTKWWSVCAVCWCNIFILSCQNRGAGVCWGDGSGYTLEDRVCHGSGSFSFEKAGTSMVAILVEIWNLCYNHLLYLGSTQWHEPASFTHCNFCINLGWVSVDFCKI